MSSSPSSSGPQAASRDRPRFGGYEFLLYVATVFGWSTSWLAIKAQLGTVAPEVSVAWRFVIAGAVMWGWVLVTGARRRFGPRDHLGFLALGAFLFSTNFALFYHGSRPLPSGLVSVVFSLASVFNIAMAAVRTGRAPDGRVLAGGLLGFAGIAALFWPELSRTAFDGATLTGLGLCAAGTLVFCTGNQISAVAQARGVPLVPSTAWGMTYGAALLLGYAVLTGLPLEIDPNPGYLIGLVWLAVFSSVVAFWAYLTLVGRIGPGRAGYATVIFPVFALLISTVVEDYRWTAAAFVGIALVMAGNILVLGGRRG